MKTPFLAVDAVIVCGSGIVLIKRENQPYRGCYALPGGFVEVGETVERAAHREVREETGLEIELLALVGVYSDPGRDPRGHVVSVAFLAEGRGVLRSGSDARSAEIFEPRSLPLLAFDHDRIIRDAQRCVSHRQLESALHASSALGVNSASHVKANDQFKAE